MHKTKIYKEILKHIKDNGRVVRNSGVPEIIMKKYNIAGSSYQAIRNEAIAYAQGKREAEYDFFKRLEAGEDIYKEWSNLK